MRLIFAVLLAIAAQTAAAGAQSSCYLSDFAESFFQTAGLKRVREQAWFTDCVVPETQSAPLWSTLESYAADANRYDKKIRRISETGGTLRVDTDGFTLSLRIYRNANGQIADIDSLQLATLGQTPQELVDDLGLLPGKVTALVEAAGARIASRDPDRPLQISSTMKFGVLRALLDEVENGRLKLQSNALVRPDLKALPSGTLHQFPDYAPVTLHTLASLMMRDSDNTATDVLIDTIGKDKVAAALGLPYLMTFHQWFMLKSDLAAYEAFAALDEKGRKAYLDGMTPAVPLSYSNSIGGITPEAGWHVSNKKLCALAGGLAASPFAQMESTPVQYDEWNVVTSKSGGDQTSRNDTLFLTRPDGKTFCVSVTWNPPADIQDDTRYVFLMTSLIEAVRRY